MVSPRYAVLSQANCCQNSSCQLGGTPRAGLSQQPVGPFLPGPAFPALQLEALRSDPSLLNSAVHEICRYHTASSYALRRVALEDVQVGAGDKNLGC